jgi:acyl dehydratase
MNICSVIGSLSALGISIALLPLANFPAQGQMTMRFTTPFVTDSGFVGAASNIHFITLAVTGFPLESATIGLPIDMGRSINIKAFDPSGKEIASTTKVSLGGVTVDFKQPVKPDTYVRLQLSGVDMSRMGGRALYRVSTKLQGIEGDVPVGSAMVSLKEQN